MCNRVSIRPYLDVQPSAKLVGEIDAIFFEASNTKSFKSDVMRAAFHDRWLGRYLREEPQFAYLATTKSEQVAGYLVGAVENPAFSERFADPGYFANFRPMTQRYPAHLHVNLAPPYRGLGIGGRLIDAFVNAARQAGAPGVHVVTNATSENARFYNRNGFLEVGRGGPDDALVFLARALA